MAYLHVYNRSLLLAEKCINLLVLLAKYIASFLSLQNNKMNNKAIYNAPILLSQNSIFLNEGNLEHETEVILYFVDSSFSDRVLTTFSIF